MKAIDRFNQLEQGILQVIKTADVYHLCLVAELRQERPDLELIGKIIRGNAVSTLAMLGETLSESERKQMATKSYVQGITSQIVLATYTALEIYLSDKFREFFRFKLSGVNAEGVLGKLSYKSLDNLKDLFKDVLDIHLPQFEMSHIIVDKHSSFKPKDTWAGIKEIEKARHSVAHNGIDSVKHFALLSDAWDRFDFVRRWVVQFDANFDCLIYEGRQSPLIRAYMKRLKSVSVASRKSRP